MAAAAFLCVADELTGDLLREAPGARAIIAIAACRHSSGSGTAHAMSWRTCSVRILSFASV